MGLVVISNKPVKKGIEIPEIEMTISGDEKSVTFGAIDKEKYAEWLSLQNPHIAFSSFYSIVGDYQYTNSAAYTGDELILSSPVEDDTVSGDIGISYNKIISY